jgi:hypothetical protein
LRKFGVVHARYWEWAAENKLDIGATAMGAYLLSCKHSNSLGCYHCPMEYVAVDLRHPVDTVSRWCAHLVDTRFLMLCERTKYVFLPKYLVWNPIQNESHAKGTAKIVESLPSSFTFYPNLTKSIKISLLPKLKGPEAKELSHTLSTRCAQGVDSVSRPYRHTETDTETDTDTEN